MSELKAFDVGLGQYCEDGTPCVVAFDVDQNPRLLNEKVYLKSEADKVIAKLESENRFVKERLEQQENTFKWHKVEVLFGKLTGDLPSRDLNRVYGRDFLVHYTVIYGNSISHGIAYSDYDEEEGFFELEENYTPVHWCEVPLPPITDKFKEEK